MGSWDCSRRRAKLQKQLSPPPPQVVLRGPARASTRNRRRLQTDASGAARCGPAQAHSWAGARGLNWEGHLQAPLGQRGQACTWAMPGGYLGAGPPPATGGRRGSSGNTAPSEPRPGDAQLNWPGKPERVSVLGAIAPGTTPRAQARGGGALPSWEPVRPVSPAGGRGKEQGGRGSPWVSVLSCQLPKLENAAS